MVLNAIGVEKLGLVVAAGAVGVIGISYIQRATTRNQFLTSAPVQNSMDILHGYTYAQSIFGTGIKPQLVDTTHRFYDRTENKANLPIVFKGNKQTGIMYSYVTKGTDKIGHTEVWKVERLDVEIKETKKRWTFYMDPNTNLERFSETLNTNELISQIKT